MPSVQEGSLKSRFPGPYKNPGTAARICMLEMRLGGGGNGDKNVPPAHWSANLAELVSFRFTERPRVKQ